MNINLFPEKALTKTVTKSGLHIVIYLNRVYLNQLFRYVMKLLPPYTTYILVLVSVSLLSVRSVD